MATTGPTQARLLAIGAIAVCLLWSFWPTLGQLADRWSNDPQYSHGYIVPLFSGFLVWRQRHRLADLTFSPSWWGVAFLAFGIALRLVGVYFFFPWLDALSLLPILAGMCLLVGGWPCFRICWPAVAFLAFMLPLPHSLQVAMSMPLQRVATLASVYLLETVGLPAVARGNVILINDTRIGVVEACNGLSMLVTFFAMATAVALLTRRGWIERVVVMLSALPIALAANVLRITITAILTEKASAATAGVFFHDLAGWLMMPLGLGLLGLELFILRRIMIEPEAENPSVASRMPAAARKSIAPKKSRKPAPAAKN